MRNHSTRASGQTPDTASKTAAVVNRNSRGRGRGPRRIQTREDGVSIDQIVLSSEKYRTARPGTAKDDNTKLQHSGPYVGVNYR